MSLFFFDTETTGLPLWKEPSDHQGQPHLVQLGAVQVDPKSREIIQTLNVIIKPNGWEIPEETIEVHGITQEKAMDVGVSEETALDIFMEMCGDSTRVAHNRTFDQRMIRIALKRYFTEEDQDKWAEKENFICTMLKTKPILKLEPKNRFGYKPPSLEEAYKHFTGRELENAHTALADAMACMDVYFGMIDYLADVGNGIKEEF